MGKTLTAAIIAGILGLAASSAQAADAACGRACLKGMLDGYIAALLAHDPSRLPIADDVKFTENGAHMFVGEGFWKTAGPGEYRLYAIDPESGQAAVQAVLSEAGQPVTFMVRLKVEAGKMVEIETLLCRKAMSGGLFAPEQGMAAPPAVFNRPVPAAERVSRAELLAAADAYFTAVQTEGSAGYKPAPFAADANRFENGLQTTNVSIRGGKALSISEQLDQGLFKGVTITDRRYPVLDVEAGVALGIVMFRRADQRVALVGGQAGQPPMNGLVSEVFKVSGGKIREVRAVMLPRPRGAPTGWN